MHDVTFARTSGFECSAAFNSSGRSTCWHMASSKLADLIVGTVPAQSADGKRATWLALTGINGSMSVGDITSPKILQAVIDDCKSDSSQCAKPVKTQLGDRSRGWRPTCLTTSDARSRRPRTSTGTMSESDGASIALTNVSSISRSRLCSIRSWH